MTWIDRARNRLFEWREHHRYGFAGALVFAGATTGVFAGLGAELLVLSAALGWLGWEVRPRFYLAMGMYSRSARVAQGLAERAGPSLRGDVARLTEASAWLHIGELAAAKAALREIEPQRLPARGRLMHFLSQATLYSRLGDGETALTMVDAASAQAEELDPPWRLLPEMNRSLAFFELGRYQDATECLRAIDPSELFPQARAYVLNNLAWSVALGEGDAGEALALAERAVNLRRSDPYCTGTLGFCMVLAGGASQTALGYLLSSLERGRGRSPAGRALLMAACAQAHRMLGQPKRAAVLEAELASTPGATRHLGRFRAALEGAGQPVLLALPGAS